MRYGFEKKGKQPLSFWQLHLLTHPPNVCIFLLSLPRVSPHLLFFSVLDNNMGDPDVKFHWPMVRRKGLDHCGLLVLILLKSSCLQPTQEGDTATICWSGSITHT